MRIRRVRVGAFGPLHDRDLELGRGMTVIAGPNESGKSTWHAAIYVAICGMRRAGGRPNKDDAAFEARHRPWIGNRWQISCELDLDDGRSIELSHDLAGRVDCAARDLVTGVDISGDLIFEGAPDASVLAGLDRRTFRTTACISQADVLGVRDSAGALRQHLERAAATAGTGETAAVALQIVDEFRRDNVGQDRANSGKPLPAAKRAVDSAKVRLAQARDEHERWLEQRATLAQLENKALTAAAVAASARSKLAADQHARAASLAAEYPEEPTDFGGDEALASAVAAAVSEWRTRPDPVPLTGRSVAELEADLELVPERPSGDLEPAQAVIDLDRDLRRVVGQLEASDRSRPLEPHELPTGVSRSELLEIARDLETPIPTPSVDAGSSVRRGGNGMLLLGLGGLAGLMAVVLLAVGQVVVGAAAGVIAIGLLVARTARSKPNAVDARVAVVEQVTAAARARRDQAVDNAHRLGLEADGRALRDLADQLDVASRTAETMREWTERHEAAADELRAVATSLAAELRDRGESPGTQEPDELLLGVDRYRKACSGRASTAREAAGRAGLASALDQRRENERVHAEQQNAVRRAEQALARAAMDAGLDHAGQAHETIASGLDRWLEQRAARGTRAQAHTVAWTELQAVLDGRTLTELADEARRLADEAGVLATEIGGPPVVELGDRPEQTVERLTKAAAEAQQALAAERRDLSVRAEGLVSVPEAEESLAGAEAELARVQALAEIIDITQRYLQEAQDRVHRDIAPALASRVREHLVRITGGRYTDLRVDPETLDVLVREAEGSWRDAMKLSHGTAEQVYLLLRIAMADVLSEGSSAVPLLLDDVTVQSDSVRTSVVLDVLHEVSDSHQVVLFTQEEDVLAWARMNLREPQDHLIELTIPG